MTRTRSIPAVMAVAASLALPAAADTPVAEIVTFRLKPDVSDAAFLETVTASEAFLAETGAVRSRTLSRDDTGLWTDHVVWTSRDAAEAAQAAALAAPSLAGFFAAVAPDSIALRHAEILHDR